MEQWQQEEWQQDVIERLVRIETRLPVCEKDKIAGRVSRVESKVAMTYKLVLIILVGVVTIAATNAKDILATLKQTISQGEKK